MHKDEVPTTRPASRINPTTGELMTDTHITTHTRFVAVGGSRFAYRRWGNPCEIDRVIVDLPDSVT